MDTKTRTALFICFFVCFVFPLFGIEYVTTVPKTGDGIYALLRRYNLPTTVEYINEFKTINSDKLNNKSELISGKTYELPLYQLTFDGKTIRSTLGYNDYLHAKSIENYNREVTRTGVKSQLYTRDLKLWVPFSMMPESVEIKHETVSLGGNNTFPIFGEKYKNVKLVDNQLKGAVYYLVSGHGGPDPGAIGKRARNKMCEDEYAYDITLRLARRLLEHGAKVYMIVRDQNDGIRDSHYLKCDSDEIYYGGHKISAQTVTRLDKRAEIINQLYNQNKAVYSTQQVVIIHVDSRSYSKRIDIFYYYEKGVAASKKLATTLYKTVKNKYAIHQPGRGYGGKVLTRDLHMLRKTVPTAVYIELGNIRNPLDQDRLVLENNRQAVANWLCEGIIKAF